MLTVVVTALVVSILIKIVEYFLNRKPKVLESGSDTIFLPSELGDEDLAWVKSTLAIAGINESAAVKTCACGYAEECYMHCNHDLGFCEGPRFNSPKTPAQIIESEHRKRTLSDEDIKTYKQILIEKRNAVLKNEFEIAKAKAEVERLKSIPSINGKPWYLHYKNNSRIKPKLAELIKQSDPNWRDYAYFRRIEMEQAVRYDPMFDAYLLPNGRRVPSDVYDDLNSYGKLEAVYEFGRREPVAYL